MKTAKTNRKIVAVILAALCFVAVYGIYAACNQQAAEEVQKSDCVGGSAFDCIGYAANLNDCTGFPQGDVTRATVFCPVGSRFQNCSPTTVAPLRYADETTVCMTNNCTAPITNYYSCIHATNTQQIFVTGTCPNPE